MQYPFMGPALAVLVLVIATSARADISAHARLGNLRYRLVDLRPNDGIAPGITFTRGGDSYVSAVASEEEKPFNLVDGESRYDGYVGFKPMGVTAQTPSVQAMARMSGQLGAGSTFNIATRGSILNDASVQESRSFQAGASPAGQSDRWYEVTPYTKVIFSGFLDMDVRRNLPNTDKFLQIARTRMVVEHSLSPNNEVAYLEYGLELVYEPDTHKSWSGRETFVYENASGRPGSGYISIQVGSEGEIFRRLNVGSSAPAAPVPEPASAALMLCGLGVVAGVARRARRR